jgi:alanine racemase
MNTNKLIIHLQAITQNYQRLQQWAGKDICLMAVIKSDAYGHGMIPVADALARVGCSQFAVFDVSEGLLLRDNGFDQSILILRGTDPENMDRAIEKNLISVLFQVEMARYLSQLAQKHNKPAKVQIKVDSGMNRLGIYPKDLEDFMHVIQKLPGLQINGFISHFAVADQPEDHYTIKQMEIFQKAIAPYAGLTSHIANSGGIIDRKGLNYPIARAGIAIYGSSPQWPLASQLEPCMTFQSKVIYTKTVPSDETISYGRTYKTTKPTRVATIPVGYADGYSRMFSNKASVLINGKRAPVIGRVCMNLTMVDISDIDNVNCGDPVILLGKQDNDCITADELASYANSISYEIMCSLGACNHRTYR